MNIIIVNDFADVNGGAGQVALTSAIALANLRHHVVVFSAVSPVMPTLREFGVDVIVTGQHAIAQDKNRLRASVQGIWNFKAQNTMDDLLASLNPKETVVHIHSWTSALSSSVIRAAIKSGFNVVCTFHDYFSACPNGGFFDFQKREICTETPLSFACISRNCDVRSYPQKLWRVARQVVQNRLGLMPSGIRHFIAVSDFSLAILKPFLPSNASVYRINNPINVERRECIDSSKNDAFTFVGRLSPEKGSDLFARAAKKAGLSPVFVGEGRLRETIVEICPQAQITGWVTGDQVQEYVSHARALVLPSFLYEGSPLVIAEAAALGIPSIVPDTCAARDLVENGQTGLWFRGGDENDLVEKIRMLQQPEFAARLGRAAYERYWASPSTSDIHVKSLIDCYEGILE